MPTAFSPIEEHVTFINATLEWWHNPREPGEEPETAECLIRLAQMVESVAAITRQDEFFTLKLVPQLAEIRRLCDIMLHP
jgi:hypothetical protein